MGNVDDGVERGSVETVTEYLKLGLRFGRVVDGFVDAYTGDPELQRQVDDETAPDPADLSRQAAALAVQVPDAGLSAARTEFLAAHLDALTAAGRRLAGEPMSFIDEVRSYFQVDIDLVDTDVYAAAHDEISALIGGSGPLAERLATVQEAETCPPEQVEAAVRAVAAALRERVAGPTGIAELPEHIDFEIARDVAWSGFNYYLGDFRVEGRGERGHRAPDEPVRGAGRARVLPRPPHRALPQGGPAGQPRRPAPSTDLPGQHPAMPDGRGPGRPGADRGGRPRLGTVAGRGARRNSGRGSTRSWSRRWRLRPGR